MLDLLSNLMSNRLDSKHLQRVVQGADGGRQRATGVGGLKRTTAGERTEKHV